MAVLTYRPIVASMAGWVRIIVCILIAFVECHGLSLGDYEIICLFYKIERRLKIAILKS